MAINTGGADFVLCHGQNWQRHLSYNIVIKQENATTCRACALFFMKVQNRVNGLYI